MRGGEGQGERGLFERWSRRVEGQGAADEIAGLVGRLRDQIRLGGHLSSSRWRGGLCGVGERVGMRRHGSTWA